MSSEDWIARTSVQNAVDMSSSEERETQIPDVSGSMAAFLCDAGRNLMSEGTPYQFQLAHILQALGEQNQQIRRLASAVGLKSSLAAPQRLSYQDPAVHLRESHMDPLVRFESAEAHRSSNTLKPSFRGNSQSAAMQSQKNSWGSPESYFESSSSWCPPRYTSDNRFSQQLFVYAIKQMEGTSWSTKYFLTYAETPWRWHKVIVIATSACGQEAPIDNNVTIPDSSECTRKLLPKDIEMQLMPLISRVKHFTSVTAISVMHQKSISADFIPGSSKLEELKNDVELENNTLDQAIRDLQDLGCKIVSESDVVVRSRVASSIFDVRVGSIRYAEHKVPFATAGKDGENGFLRFLTGMKTIYSLQGYTGVAGFGGVVLDDTKRCLKGYLSEFPAIYSLTKLFATLKGTSEEIPWPLRQLWAVQIVKIVAGLHRRDRVIGVLDIAQFGVREDGRVVLTRCQAAHRHLENAKGIVPPDLRQTLDEHSENGFTFKTDIFQLGYVLWLLIQQKFRYRGMLCTINACTKFPRHTCREPHTNPIELPYCGSKVVPPIIDDQIRACRSTDPKRRPSACNIARTLEQNIKTDKGWLERHARDRIAHYISAYTSTTDILVCCCECGMPLLGVYHHCDSCYQGDFDVCQTCLYRGVTCLEPQRHRLRRRFRTSETITHGS